MRHQHHIIPRHMGGSNDPSNLAMVTVAEHAEAHRKLYEQYGHQEDYIAWRGLEGIISHEEAVYEQIVLASKKGADIIRGKKQPKTHIAKRIASRIETINNGKSQFKKISSAVMSRTNSKIVTCPNCNKSGGQINMKRYHFDNCKVL